MWEDVVDASPQNVAVHKLPIADWSIFTPVSQDHETVKPWEKTNVLDSCCACGC